MRTLLKALYHAVPLAIVVAAAVLPLPLTTAMGGMLVGLLLFQLALVGSFDAMLPDKRQYIALREETDRLLSLVRELNATVLEARAAGLDPESHARPLLRALHASVDRLPAVAGVGIEETPRLQPQHLLH